MAAAATQNGPTSLPNGVAAPTPVANGSPAAPAPQDGAAANQPHGSSLYVGDLDRDVTEAQIFELFSQIGPLQSIRVCRDAVTRRSLGYAYVNYNNSLDPTAAERAVEALNYTPLGSRPMRIMWSHRDPAARRSGVGNIFIKNLDKSIDNKALHDTFSAFGNILSCKVAADSSGSKGYGFVHYDNQAAAQLAIEKVNAMSLAGKKVYVGPFQKKSERPADGEIRFTNVYVKSLPDSVDDDKLLEMFSEYGNVTSAVVMKDEGGKSRGFGFINFDDASAAREAVDALDGKEIDGSKLYAGRAQKKSERESELKAKREDIKRERIAKFQGLNLFVKNLADEVDDDRLRQEFQPFGSITSATVMRDAAGKSKGFGFVCFTSNEEATRAITEANNRMLCGKPIFVALAQQREVRQQQLQQQYAQRLPQLQAMQTPRGPPQPPMAGMFPQGGAFPPQSFYGPPPPGGMPRPPQGPGPMGMFPPMMPGRMPMQGRMGGRGPRPYGMQGMPPNMMGIPPMMGPGPMMGQMGPGGRFGPGGRGGRGARGDGRGGRGIPAGRGPVPAPPAAGRGRGPAGALPGAGTQAVLGAPPAGKDSSSAMIPGQEGQQLTTAMLAAATEEQQKQMLGERIFPKVAELQGPLAAKITGMLLEMENSELLVLLEGDEALASKVDEAIQVLKAHNALPPGVEV